MANVVDMKAIVKHIVDGTLGENLCRICLLPLGGICENIFTKICKEDKEYCIADVLEKVCNMEISEADEYNVCLDCFIKASAAYKFYLLSQRSNEILNFYVDELENNVNCIETPVSTSNDYLCITLPKMEPETRNFDYDLKGCLGEYHVERDPGNNKDEEFVVIIKEPKEKPVVHEEKSPGKVHRKRDPMTYKLCTECPVKYRFVAKLQEHMKQDHGIDLSVCKVCKYTTTDDHEFEEHLHTHKNIHRCAICNAVFKRRKTIISHLQWHADMNNMSQKEGAHICEHCGVILPDGEELRAHYDKKHNKQYTCFYCGRRYRGESSFEMHIAKHEEHMRSGDKARNPSKAPQQSSKPKPKGSRQWECSTCGRHFVDERSLSWHTMLHTDERPYTCDTCGRGFISLNRRNQHATCAHTAPSRRCPLCPALFHLRSMVNSHIKKVHLKAHKRRNRTSKHANVSWRTEPVPIQELSVCVQSQLLEMQTREHKPEHTTIHWLKQEPSNNDFASS